MGYGDQQRCGIGSRGEKLDVGAGSGKSQMDKVWRKGTSELRNLASDFRQEVDVVFRNRCPKWESVDRDTVARISVREIEVAVGSHHREFVAPLREGRE